MAKMNKIIFVLAILVILLIGCSEEGTYEREKTETSGPNVNEYDQADGEVDDIAKKAYNDMSEELNDLISKSDNIGSMQYAYDKFVLKGENIFIEFYVKGGKIKQVHSLRSGEYVDGTRYDTVYIDVSVKIVEAYCEDEEKCGYTDQISVNYDDFIIDTPLDLLNSIEYGEIVGSEIFDNKNCILVDSADGKRIWIWDYNGIPIKYAVYNSDDEVIEKVEYLSMVVNQLKDRDVVKQS